VVRLLNKILEIGDRVRVVRLETLHPDDEFNPRVHEPSENFLETASTYNDRCGVVVAVDAPDSHHQVEFVDVEMDDGYCFRRLHRDNIRRRIRTFLPEDGFTFIDPRDTADEQLWFHMTNDLDFGG